MNGEWKCLYEAAMGVLNPHDISNKMLVSNRSQAPAQERERIITDTLPFLF